MFELRQVVGRIVETQPIVVAVPAASDAAMFARFEARIATIESATYTTRRGFESRIEDLGKRFEENIKHFSIPMNLSKDYSDARAWQWPAGCNGRSPGDSTPAPAAIHEDRRSPIPPARIDSFQAVYMPDSQGTRDAGRASAPDIWFGGGADGYAGTSPRTAFGQSGGIAPGQRACSGRELNKYSFVFAPKIKDEVPRYDWKKEGEG